jgi:hypothetical protein
LRKALACGFRSMETSVNNSKSPNVRATNKK